MGFPEQLAALRRTRGLTQAGLAERAGVHVNQIGRYEHGLAEPSVSVLAQLAIALSVSTDALVFADSPRLPDDEVLRLAFESTVHLDQDERDAVRLLLQGFLSAHTARHGGDGPRRARTKSS